MTTFLFIAAVWLLLASIFGREYRMRLDGFWDHFFWFILWPFVMGIVELERKVEEIRKRMDE